MAGRPINTIEPLMVATNMPIVVFDSAIHLYDGWSLSQRLLGDVRAAILT